MAFRPSVAQIGLVSPYDDMIVALTGGDLSTVALVKGVIATESEWNPGAINPADPSYGLMQILLGPGGPFPSVSAQDLLDPSTNLTLGITHLQSLLTRYGSPGAIAAYNAGTPRLNSSGQYVNSRGDTMVQGYVDSVLTYQTWYLNAMFDQQAGGIGTADITRSYDAALTVTAYDYGAYPTETYYDAPGAEPSSFPEPSTVMAGGGLAIILLAIGAIWWSQS